MKMNQEKLHPWKQQTTTKMTTMMMMIRKNKNKGCPHQQTDFFSHTMA